MCFKTRLKDLGSRGGPNMNGKFVPESRGHNGEGTITLCFHPRLWNS